MWTCQSVTVARVVGPGRLEVFLIVELVLTLTEFSLIVLIILFSVPLDLKVWSNGVQVIFLSSIIHFFDGILLPHLWVLTKLIVLEIVFSILISIIFLLFLYSRISNIILTRLFNVVDLVRLSHLFGVQRLLAMFIELHLLVAITWVWVFHLV